MNVEAKVKAFHTSDLNRITYGSAVVMTYDQSTRIKRVLKTLGMVWGLAIASILIPIVHFFLPWMGIIAGPILASWIYGIDSEIITGSFACPRCSIIVPIVKQRNRWPLRELCVSCSSEINVEKIT